MIRLCPECGKELPPGLPEGMCPNCLLKLGARADRELEPAADTLSPAVLEKPGARIARYRLLETIGEGGFGTVWMAEQEEPVRRRVALKIIKLGMDTKEVVARFEAERQALAMMDHPNIARVFDGGATENGRPYFVMELVEGVRITDYCDAHDLNTEARLRLFMQVCEAVQHAHQKGIIHRDLKPNNVLVTVVDDRPVPKVIDFGIAKATAAKLTEKTFFTGINQIIGTPVYMSPEQAEPGSLDIDTRSDIYALGVILYELLTGRTPFSNAELLQAGLEEMLRTIREKEPPKPSTRLSTLAFEDLQNTARHRAVEPGKLPRLVRGELDWIVMKCLEKARARRYETAAGLAGDVERFLNHDPVSAAAPGAAYRFAKFARRNRVALATVAAFAMVLVVAAVVSSWQAVRATRFARAEEIRRKEAQTAQAEADRQRGLAEQNLKAARHHLYAADMNIVGQALAVNNQDRVRALLRKQVPAAGEADLRGWEWRYFAQESRDRSARQLNHPRQAVKHLAFLPDGRSLLSFAGDGQAATWDWPAGTLRTRVGERLSDVAVSRSGRFVASARSGGVELFEWPGTNRVQWLPKRSLVPDGEPGLISINHLAFSPDERWLACSGPTAERTRFRVHCSVWDWREARLVFRAVLTNQLHVNNGALAFSPDGRRLGLAGSPGTVKIFRLPEGEEERALHVHDEQILAVAFSPDGRWLAAGSGMRDSWVRLFGLNDNFSQRILRGHSSYVSSLVFSPDSRWLVSGGNDQTVRLWDTRELTLSRTFRGHGSEVTALAVSPDGREIVSGASDGGLKVWPMEPEAAGTDLVQLPFLNLMRFSDDLKSFAGLTDQGAVVTAATAPQPKLERVSGLGRGHVPFSTRLDLSPDGRRIVLADAQGGLRLWDRSDGRTITNAMAHGRAVWHLAFVRDGQEIVGFDGAGWVKTWSLDLAEKGAWQVRKEIRRAPKNLAPELGVFVGRGPDTLEFFDLKDGHPLGSVATRGGELTGIAVSPDRQTVAISDDLGTVELWDTKTWRVRHRLRGHLQSVRSIAFSPDGNRLAIGGIGLESVKLWDVGLLQELCTLPVDSPVCHTLKFSRDGRALAVAMGPAGFQILQAPELHELPAEAEVPLK